MCNINSRAMLPDSTVTEIHWTTQRSSDLLWMMHLRWDLESDHYNHLLKFSFMTVTWLGNSVWSYYYNCDCKSKAINTTAKATSTVPGHFGQICKSRQLESSGEQASCNICCMLLEYDICNQNQNCLVVTRLDAIILPYVLNDGVHSPMDVCEKGNSSNNLPFL